MITQFEYEDEEDIFLSSRLVHSRGMKAHRYVLRKLGSMKWVTHLETLGLVIVGDVGTWKHDGFHHGNYFETCNESEAAETFDKAVEDFRIRSERL